MDMKNWKRIIQRILMRSDRNYLVCQIVLMIIYRPGQKVRNKCASIVQRFYRRGSGFYQNGMASVLRPFGIMPLPVITRLSGGCPCPSSLYSEKCDEVPRCPNESGQQYRRRSRALYLLRELDYSYISWEVRKYADSCMCEPFTAFVYMRWFQRERGRNWVYHALAKDKMSPLVRSQVSRFVRKYIKGLRDEPALINSYPDIHVEGCDYLWESPVLGDWYQPRPDYLSTGQRHAPRYGITNAFGLLGSRSDSSWQLAMENTREARFKRRGSPYLDLMKKLNTHLV